MTHASLSKHMTFKSSSDSSLPRVIFSSFRNGIVIFINLEGFQKESWFFSFIPNKKLEIPDVELSFQLESQQKLNQKNVHLEIYQLMERLLLLSVHQFAPSWFIIGQRTAEIVLNIWSTPIIGFYDNHR